LNCLTALGALAYIFKTISETVYGVYGKVN